MKVLEARTTGIEEAILMSWSPKMDLLVNVYSTGQISLYRLSWQRIWQVGCFKEGIPTCLTWHPEGQYICASIKNTLCILEVENGRITAKHNLDEDIKWAKWCATKYEVSSKEKAAREIAVDRNKFPLEARLSILLVGTSNGQVSVYTGGHIFTLHFRIPSLYPLTILSGDSSHDVQCFEFVSQRRIDNESTEFVFNHLRTSILPPLMGTIGELGLQFISLKHSWESLQNQLQSFSEHWKKIYDIYDFYITLGDTQPKSKTLSHYFELLLNGVDSVEIQIFLSSNMREKEAKKKTVVITSNSRSLSELASAIKSGLCVCLYDVQSISQFMHRVSRVDDNLKSKYLAEFENNMFYMLYFVVQAHVYAQTFVDGFLQFMRLISYTTHLYATTNEYFNDFFNTEKVIGFLDSKVHKNIYEFFILNNADCWESSKTLPQNEELPTTPIRKMLAALGGGRPRQADLEVSTEKFVENILGYTIPSDSEIEDTEEELKVVESKKKKYSPKSKEKCKKTLKYKNEVELSFESMKCVLRNLLIISNQVGELFKIPLVDPFYCFAQYVLFEIEGDTSVQPVSAHVSTNSTTWKTNVFLQLNNYKMYLYEFDCSNYENTVKSTCLNFSRQIISSAFYSDQYLTLVSYDSKDKRGEQENGRTIVCQLCTSSALIKGIESEIGFSMTTEQIQYLSTPPPVPLDVPIPIDVYRPGPTNSPLVGHVLPIEDVCPILHAVSGARKVGSLLTSNRRKILLLDLDIALAYDEDDYEMNDY